MPTQKQISASIDDRLAKIQAGVDLLVARTAPVVVQEPEPEIPVPPPVVVTPPPPTPTVVFEPDPVPGYVRPCRTELPKVIRQPSDLGTLVLPFTWGIGVSELPTYAPGSDYKSAGMVPGMGTTGERQEIGLVTEAQAAWLAGGSPHNMLVQAEAHNDVPVHFGKVDIFATPDASCYYKWDSVNGHTPVGNPAFNTRDYSVIPETAHYPALNYVPYLATGDIRYLEGLQAQATFNLIQGPPVYRFFMEGQPRGFAWMLRDLAACYLATPDNAPAHLLPKSYWKKVLDKYRDAFKAAWVNNQKPLVQNTHAAFDVKLWIAPWEQDYFGFVLGWMVYAGLEDWRENYEWSVKQAILRAPFGAKAIGYHWFVNPQTVDYPTLLAANPSVDDANYKAFLRGNLKVATLNKVAGAQQAFEAADAMAKDYIPGRWAA